MAQQIICVDDQKDVRELIEELFQARGRDAVCFSSAAPAVAFLASQQSDVALALIDYDLGPDEPNGLELMQTIRAEHPQLPMIMLTGKGSVEVAVAAVKAGA